MTLHIGIPQTTADLQFFFLPYCPEERIFKCELKGVSLVDDGKGSTGEGGNGKNGRGSLSLYALKKKICEVAKQFYGPESHNDEKHGMSVKFRLTSHNSPNQNYGPGVEMPELRPHDLIISSVNMYNFKFRRIFSEHMGHTLTDVVNEVGRNMDSNFMFVHQIDPQAVDI